MRDALVEEASRRWDCARASETSPARPRNALTSTSGSQEPSTDIKAAVHRTCLACGTAN